MSEVTSAELANNVSRVVDEVQKAQGTLLEGIRELKNHETDENAHGIDIPGSPFRTAVENVAFDALMNGDTNATIQKVISSKVSIAINSTLPGVLEEELKSPISNLSSVVDEQISVMVDKKIKDGALGDAVNSSIGAAKSTANVAKQTADAAKTNADAAKSAADSAKTTATAAQSTANTAKSTADSALSTANAAKNTADAALPKSANAVSASKLATARNLQVNLGSTAIASFDGTANKDIGVKGVTAIANGGTGANNKDAACDNLGAVKKSGNRGELAGSETASSKNGSQTITATSPDCMNISTSGAVTLTFTPAAANVRAVKAICLTASAATALSVAGAVWANNGTAPVWGDTGKILVLLAHFVGGRVVLSVADNTQ